MLVWTTRIGNIWRDDTLDTAGKWGRTGLAGTFTVLAVAALVGLATKAAWLRPVVTAFAVWTTGVWIVRIVGIAVHGHEAAFVIVHTVLAVISVGLAVQAVREQRAPIGAVVS
jgi:hypothetical protein